MPAVKITIGRKAMIEKYPKLSYKATCFSACSSSEFELYVEGITKKYGEDIFQCRMDEQRIAEIVSEKTKPEKWEKTIFYVKEALQEFYLRHLEKKY
jgi:hypothetical protein